MVSFNKDTVVDLPALLVDFNVTTAYATVGGGYHVNQTLYDVERWAQYHGDSSGLFMLGETGIMDSYRSYFTGMEELRMNISDILASPLFDFPAYYMRISVVLVGSIGQDNVQCFCYEMKSPCPSSLGLQ